MIISVVFMDRPLFKLMLIDDLKVLSDSNSFLDSFLFRPFLLHESPRSPSNV